MSIDFYQLKAHNYVGLYIILKLNFCSGNFGVYLYFHCIWV